MKSCSNCGKPFDGYPCWYCGARDLQGQDPGSRPREQYTTQYPQYDPSEYAPHPNIDNRARFAPLLISILAISLCLTFYFIPFAILVPKIVVFTILLALAGMIAGYVQYRDTKDYLGLFSFVIGLAALIIMIILLFK